MACTPLVVRGQARIQHGGPPCYVGKQVPTKRQDILYGGIMRRRLPIYCSAGRRLRALSRHATKLSSSNGLRRKPYAPASMAWASTCSSKYAVTKIIGTREPSAI